MSSHLPNEFVNLAPTPVALRKRITLGLLSLVALAGSVFLSAELKATDIETINTFDTNNVVIANGVAYAAAGSQGVVVVDLGSLAVADVVSPPAGSASIDDVSVDGDLLFVLDGIGGNLSVFSIASPLQPSLVSGPVSVAVSPFAGVSAANERVVVSGGTGLLSVIVYNQAGTLSGPITTIDLGVGQPDVLISEDGQSAFVSTDFAGFVNGQSFGITLIDISATPGSISVTDQVGIPGAGFSPGVDGPANFPIESAQQGDTLFVASGAGVAVIDISNLNAAQTIAQIPLPTNPVNVDIVGDTLYVVGNSPTATLTVIDISDLSSPVVETTSLPAGGDPLSVAATDSHLVIADSALGVLVEVLLIPGDVNGDGAVDLLDVQPFVDAVLSGKFLPAADLNGDGEVDLLDVQPFVALLIG